MKAKNSSTILILIILLLLPTLACSLTFQELKNPSRTRSEEPVGSEGPEEEKAGAKTEITGNEIEISQTTGYLDSFGFWSIHGLVSNTAEYSVGLAEIEVILQEGGPSETYLIIPNGLAPGEVMPFELRLPQSTTNLGDFQLNILQLQRIRKETIPLEISQSNLTSAENGMVSLTAELMNNSTKNANLNSIQAALFSGDGQLITSVSCQECPRSVLAGDIVPVKFLFFGHPTEPAIDHFEIYISSANNTEFMDFEISLIDPIHTFQDELGWFHILGDVKNESEHILDLTILGTFFDQNGTVLGSASTSPALHSLNPGESCPFELKIFTTDEQIADWNIQVDQALSRIVDTPSLELTPTSTQTTPSDFNWLFTGSVTNDSQITLNYIRVVIGLRDIQSGKLVGLAEELLLGDFAAGSTTEYSLTIRTDPAFDPSGLEEIIVVRGR